MRGRQAFREEARLETPHKTNQLVFFNTTMFLEYLTLSIVGESGNKLRE
jgi:hypothetical protein